MDDDQQFCLRWNNHQSTLIAVFDTLLENGTLVDCTLAAEGKFLNAHKVVLSACSPYFESLLSQNYDKHPIFILKDVKFQELKAMMDYMYRGEVNISQDQLGALLKAAESLQIKGLSDNRKGETETRKSAPPPPPPAKSPPPAPSLPRVQGLTIEQRRAKDEDSAREGSQSPGPRKRKRLRRRSTDDLVDNHHDASNSSESHHGGSQTPASLQQNIPATLPASSKLSSADVPEPVETKSEIMTRHKASSLSESEIMLSSSGGGGGQQSAAASLQVPTGSNKEKLEPATTHTELMLEPKAEYVDEMNEDSIEDLTLDDDDISNMDQMDDGAGPSHGNMGEGSSQGFGSWHMGNQSQDEVFLAAQEAVGAHRDSQGEEEEEEGRRMEGKRPQKQQQFVGDEELVEEEDDEEEEVGDVATRQPVLQDEDFSEDDLTKIREELGDHITFKQQEPTPAPAATAAAAAPALKKKIIHVAKVPEIRVLPPQKTITIIKRKAISSERMKRFLSMTPQDIAKPVKKQYACERDLKDIKFPKDTLRCTLCGILYERENHLQHVKECPRSVQAKPKFGCLSCNFKHADKQEIQKHVAEVHGGKN